MLPDPTDRAAMSALAAKHGVSSAYQADQASVTADDQDEAELLAVAAWMRSAL